MINIARCFQDLRLFKAVTGMTYVEFTALLPAFDAVLKQGALTNRSPRQRRQSGGRTHTLASERETLFFILLYVKCYATVDVLAWLFDEDRAQPHRWVSTSLPVLEAA